MDGLRLLDRTTDAKLGEPTMLEAYVQLTRMIERLHRRFLDVLGFELERLHIDDLSPPQALMLTKIEDRDVSVRDFVERDYYLRSIASYNIRQMVQAGYVVQERSSRDRRAMRIRLTEKGKELCARITELECSHAKILRDDLAPTSVIESATETLRRIERTWNDFLSYQAL